MVSTASIDASHIIDEINKRSFKKTLIVTDSNLIKFHVVHKVTNILAQHQLPYEIFDGVMPNPTILVVQNGIEVYKQSNADYIIAIIINNPQFSDIRSLEGLSSTN